MAQVLEVDGYVGVKLSGTVCSYLFQPPYATLELPKNRLFCSFLAADVSPFKGSSFTPSGLVLIFCLFNISLQSPLNFIVWSGFFSSLILVTCMINFVCNPTLIVTVQSEAVEESRAPL